jgi:hypothetical protein
MNFEIFVLEDSFKVDIKQVLFSLSRQLQTGQLPFVL